MKKASGTIFVTIIIIIVLIAILFITVSSEITQTTIESMGKGVEENLQQEINEQKPDFGVDLSEYEEVNVSLVLTNVMLSSECYVVSFGVTSDQAYSIGLAIEKEPSIRPLTHDIMRDVLENFDIEILAGMVSDYKNGIYYATIYSQREKQVLELDARPSDTIALMLRLDKPLYVKKTILGNSTYIC